MPLAAALGFFYPVVFRGKVFWGGDITDFFYPTRAVLSEALREGNPGILIWNPYIFGGYPLLAEGQIGAFYPLNGLFALPAIPMDIFLTLHLILHLFLAATFAYLYARTLRI